MDAVNARTAQSVAQTAITAASILSGLLLILFVQPPGGLEWKHVALTAALAIGFVLILADPRLRSVFELQPLSLVDYLVLTLVVAIWALLVRSIWRWQLLGRLLGSASPIPK